MEFLAYLAILVVAGAISYALAPKPPKQKPATLDDFNLPTAEEGRAIPWIFGTYKITDPNVIWYGDLGVRTQTKNKVKTRTYQLGIHMELCISPVDKLLALTAGDKDLGITPLTASAQITIAKRNLFGGRSGEGGVNGTFDILFGEPTQPVNDYLAAKIGTPLSAFRDSLTIVGRKATMTANTTYVKPWTATVRCIEAGWEGGSCWYPEKAFIPDEEGTATTWTEEFSTLAPYSLVQGSASAFTLSGGVLHITGHDPLSQIRRTPEPGAQEYTYVSGDFILYAVDYNDPGTITLAAASGWAITFDPARANYYDSSRLPRVLASSGTTPTTGTAIYGSALSTLTWYRVEFAFNYTSGDCVVTLSVRGGATLGSLTINLLAFNPLEFMTFSAAPDGSWVGWDNIRFDYNVADAWDMNPAHIIYKVLTATDQGAAEPSATIDDGSFRAAADTFYAERLGCSFNWRNEGTIFDFIAEVCRHAGAVLTYDPETGKTQLVPLRDDYDPNALDLLTEDHVIEVVEWQDAADGEAVNEVTTEFRERDGNKGTATWTNRASVQQQGLSHQTISFPGITRRDTALRLAKRECLQRSSQLSKGKLKANRHGWDKLPGSLFRFSHGPEGIGVVVLRVVDIDLGTLADGAITVSVVEDIFALGDALDVGTPASGYTPPDTAPAAVTDQALLEAPYWQLLGDLGAAETAGLPTAAGYLLALAAKPTDVSLGFDAWARISPAAYADTAPDTPFAPTATLAAALHRQTDASIALADTVDLDLVEVGWLAVVGAGSAAEICVVATLDLTLAEVGLLRGRADTTPQEHAAGTRVWFLEVDTGDWPRLPTQWADGNAVDAKLLTATPAGVLDIASATAVSATLASRQIRPYAPGNIELNAEAYPDLVEGPLTVTWAHRDRIVQGTTLVSQYDATDYGPEAGATLNAWAYDDGTNALLDSDTGLTGTSWAPSITVSTAVRIEIEAERAGHASWQRQVRTFTYLATGGILTEASDYLLTEGGEYILQET